VTLIEGYTWEHVAMVTGWTSENGEKRPLVTGRGYENYDFVDKRPFEN